VACVNGEILKILQESPVRAKGKEISAPDGSGTGIHEEE